MTQGEQREEAVFEAALKLPVDHRPAYLDNACAGDVDLRRRVEVLLNAFERAGGFMRQPAISLSPSGGEGQGEGALRRSLPTEKPGDKIGRYKLLEQIGEGGCGVVYVAEQEEPVRRRVALKVIKLGMDTKQVIARFDAERQALAMMDHPNIAKVFDAGSTESPLTPTLSPKVGEGVSAGRPYFVMELVRGIKITDYCDQNQLPPRERLDLFIQVCRAIQHAHQKGVIHRDIKPSNILVTLHDGVPVPKVIDFGIAKATQGRLTDQTVYTAFEQFIGTPAYMSPEQAELSGLDIDTRSDIYSLGVLLYELLTGKTPFDAKELLSKGLDEMRRTIREVEPVKPSTRLTQELNSLRGKGEKEKRGSELPPSASPFPLFSSAPFPSDLDWIVMKCLEKDRARRYETANGLATDISRHLNHEPVVARPPSNLYRFAKLVRRNKLAFGLAAALAVLPLVIITSLLVSNARITRERNQKDAALKERSAALQEKSTALEAARTSEQEAKNQLFLSLRSQAQGRRYSRQMGQRFESLAALTEAARLRSDESLRDDAIAALALPDVRPGFDWQLADANGKFFAFDGLYRRYLSMDDLGTICIRGIPENQELTRLKSSPTLSVRASGRSLLFSPDGRFLAKLEDEGRLRVWRSADGQAVLREAPEKCSALAFSPNSELLAVGQENKILILDLVAGRQIKQWATPAKPYWIGFAPAQPKLAVGYRTNAADLTIFNADDGSVLARLPFSGGAEAAAWHPDGRRLAFAGFDPRIQIWDVETKRRLATLAGHGQDVTGLCFHPDGGLLASGSWDGTERLWDVASGRQWLQIPFALLHLQFSLDGRWLGVLGAGRPQDARLLELASGREYRSLCNNLDPTDGEPMEGDISSDGQLLAMSAPHGVGLWDLATGRELVFLPIGETRSAFFPTNGQELLTCGRGAGLQRWRIQRDPIAPNELRLGPPQSVRLPFVPERIACSADGRWVAVVMEGASKILRLDLQSDTASEPLLSHAAACFIAVSRDHRWMASSGWLSDQVCLWDVASNRLAHEWSFPGGMSTLAFSPDSRSLVVSRPTEFSFWDVESLKLSQKLDREANQFPVVPAFSTGGKLMALEMSPGVIHLKDAATFRTIAKLTDPFADRATWLGFVPDGTKLVVGARYSKVIHVWDLRAIRAQLKPMGLDWDWPEFPPVVRSENGSDTPPLKIQVIGVAPR